MFLCFGEIMLRLAPEGYLRLRQVLPGRLDSTFAGCEANVAVSLALFGQKVRFMSVLPENILGDTLQANLKSFGVDTSCCLQQSNSRLGIYFVETGANQRSSVVIYDRDNSAISKAGPKEYDFERALEGVRWVHISGITPALSEKAFQATKTLAEIARKRGAEVSCDLNFRGKLWNWKEGVAARELAQDCMLQILPHITVLVANEEDAHDVLGIQADGTSVEQGEINAAAYGEVALKIVKQFPNLKKIAFTLRESLSANHNNWGAMLYDPEADECVLAPLDAEGNYHPYEIRNIVDRVGGGDSFAAGLIHALSSGKYQNNREALQFAVAASCLGHSIKGDFNYIEEQEVEALLKGTGSGRVRR